MWAERRPSEPDPDHAGEGKLSEAVQPSVDPLPLPIDDDTFYCPIVEWQAHYLA